MLKLTQADREAQKVIDEAPPTIRWIASVLTNMRYAPVEHLREPREIAVLITSVKKSRSADLERQRLTAKMIFEHLIPLTLTGVAHQGLSLGVIAACHLAIQEFMKSETDTFSPDSHSETGVHYVRKAFIAADSALKFSKSDTTELWRAIDDLLVELAKVQ